MEVLTVESQLIELRTQCQRYEVTPAAALGQLKPLRARVNRLVRRIRQHPSLTKRMAKISPRRGLSPRVRRVRGVTMTVEYRPQSSQSGGNSA